MAEQLFPVIETPEKIGVSSQYDQRYKRSYKWDFEMGDFARDGANRVSECNGLEAYKTWCTKAVATERRTCLAYPGEVGADMLDAFGKPSRRAQESAIERTIKETLMVNPRTEYVRDFSFAWANDLVTVAFTVKGIDYESFRVEI